MEFSERWLREWVNPNITSAKLSEQLTMAGLEVDSIHPVSETFNQVVIGCVESIEPHPNADRLRVCQVNVGQAEQVQIVCGAPNVTVGMRAPTALVGAKLPNNLNIKAAKLRGVASSGMLCSAVELGLAEQADGLWGLPHDAPIGTDIRDYLQLDDQRIEIDLTPNRGDCLSISGISREVATLNRCELLPVKINAVAAQHEQVFPVVVETEAQAACPRYCGRVITNIDSQAETPLWLQEKLRRSGLRSLGPMVDVTNYVLLELGQPMHAFDLEKLTESIHVRYAKQDETLTLLDGNDVVLSTNTLVIADKEKAVALAGVMGGADTAVSADTTQLFLESAFFNPITIAGKARQYNTHSDSSHRFERGVDFNLPALAMERATELLLSIVGGDAGPVIEVCDTSLLPKRQPILLRSARIAQVLGMQISNDEVDSILQHLGMQLAHHAEGWMVTPPSYRFDLELEVDLIEEVGRIHGYDKLPSHYPQVGLGIGHDTETTTDLLTLKRGLVARGYQEAITYSFVDPKIQALFDPERKAIALANPIAADMAVMRTQLWPGLIQALLHNQKRQQKRIRLFEQGLNFIPQAELEQKDYIAGIVVGEVYPEQWGLKPQMADFFTVKADIESLLGTQSARFTTASHPALHPGQTAKIMIDDVCLGWIGTLHPLIAQTLKVAGQVILFELATDLLLQRQVPTFQTLSKFPAVHRDLAIVIDESVSVQAVVDCINELNYKKLQDIQLFDLYCGSGVESNCKSLAMRFIFQDPERTFEDAEIDGFVDGILQQLKTQFNASLRG